MISASIIHEGWKALKIATSELVDAIPRELGDEAKSKEAAAISEALTSVFPGSRVLLRETGRYIRAEVVGAVPPEGFDAAEFAIPGLEDRWRLDSIAFRP